MVAYLLENRGRQKDVEQVKLAMLKEKYKTPPFLLNACKAGDLNDVKYIVEIIGEEVNGVKDVDGKTGAYYAAFHEREDVVAYLLESGGTQMDVKNGRNDFNNQLKTIVGEDNMKILQQGDQLFTGTLNLNYKSINDDDVVYWQ